MIKTLYIDRIVSMLGLKTWQVENCIRLLEEGATIPFISRYRKERTGGMDEVSVAEVRHWTDVFTQMEKRKETILQTISDAGKLDDSLKLRIEGCTDARELEDLYLPYRPKRRTRATQAKEAGLEPLAEKMYSVGTADPVMEVSRLKVKGLTVDEALSGARDIMAEWISETASFRDTLRSIFRTRRIVTRATKASEDPKAQKYRSCFGISESLDRMAPHRLLAILRAADEGYLSVKIDADPEKCCKKLYYDFCQARRYPSPALGEQIRQAFDDAYRRLMEPSISSEVIRDAKVKADIESIRIFGENLRQLLLAPPVGQKRLMAIDPGFRTGCKVVCLDESGNLLHHEAVFPHPPVSQKVKAIQSLSSMIQKYGIEVIAIGDGTAGRETEEFVRNMVPKPENCLVYSVSEDGASIYSASDAAREEFPDCDLTVRGSVSIGRRLMDPLAELVKIDPKSLGIGQYQHDVDQDLLKEKLDSVVESCVNNVGVNLNTASPYLLSYVSGIGPALARNIVEYRTENGSYTSRSQLLKVKRLGERAYQQCAGFLRIPGASNPLDNSAVHPESYHIVDRMAGDMGVNVEQLVGNGDLCSAIDASDYVNEDFGLPTVNDILKELVKPGRDPRGEAEAFSFAGDIRTIEDLKVGMKLPGIVTNITAFGAFVDIGIHENGLIHVSQMGKGQRVPGHLLSIRQKVQVEVLNVDMDRKRISLRLL